MPIVGMPNGDQVSFPDNMPPDQIKSLIAKKFPNDVAAHYSNMAEGIRSGMSWSDVAKSAVSNIPSSAGQVVSDIAQTVAHPIETAENIGKLGKGIMQKLGGFGKMGEGDESIKYSDAVGKFFMDRYGSIDAIKKTIAEDPVGALADVATVFSGGAFLPGKAGQVAGAVSRAVDPLTAVAKTAKGVAKVGSEAVGGLLTGTGGRAVEEAALSGAKAITEPSQGAAFRANYSGKIDPAVVVKQAQTAVSSMIKERGAEYVTEMKKLGADKLQLNYDKIDKALDTTIGKFEGKSISPSIEGVLGDITKRVEEWKTLGPQFQTPAGFDALKKYIADIRNLPGNTDQFGRQTAQGIVVKNVENAIKATIEDQSPQYAKIMGAYSDATEIINNLQRELSLGRNANVDTGLRKLQSVLRNNVSTSYARRERLAEFLKDNGATTLLSALAGQQMSSIIPRGLAARVFAAGAAFMGMEHGELAKHLGIAALSSPKLAGGIAHAGGIAASPLYAAEQAVPGLTRGLGRSAFQAGRLPE